MTRIAIMGTRGVPASYGGFETFAEELGKRLVENGHKVDVWGRNYPNQPKKTLETHLGMDLKYSYSIAHKYLDTPLASLTSFLGLITNRPDIVLLCNAANSPMAWIIKLLGIPLVINVDGIERKRAKWGIVGKLGYRVGEYCSVLFANRIIADAQVIAKYYKDTYDAESDVITYGANVNKIPAGEVLAKFNLKPKEYILYVSRLEKENNALGVIQAYTKLNVDYPLVVVGDAPYAEEYKKELRQAANDKVIFTGFQFREAYRELRTNCYFYVQATEVGGTHPALVEAMAYGNTVIGNGTDENIEVLGDAGLFFEHNNWTQLAQIMQKLIDQPELVEHYGQLAVKRANEHYTWDKVTSEYESLFQRVLSK